MIVRFEFAVGARVDSVDAGPHFTRGPEELLVPLPAVQNQPAAATASPISRAEPAGAIP